MFNEIVSFDNLIRAAHRTRKGKRYRQSSLEFFSKLEENIIQLQNELIFNEYVPGIYRDFYIHEPKKRLISAPCFRDRVLQQAIYGVLEPVIDKRFIYDSYACRTGKGTHAGADRAQRFIRIVKRNHGRVYALKADISKYFHSIDHAILKGIVHRHVKCQRTLNLLFDIIDCSPSQAPGVGIPLGNLTSQLFANMYLNELDRLAKHHLRERFYIRYMDDFVILHHDKAHLHKLRWFIEGWLGVYLKLSTNHKTQVFPISPSNGRALDFLGYRIYATHRLLRKCSVKRIKHKLKRFRREVGSGKKSISDIRPNIVSWLGHAQHADSFGLVSHILDRPFTLIGEENETELHI